MYKERFTEQELLGISPESVLQEPDCADVEAFAADFRIEADRRDKNGDKAGARAFRLLSAISNFHFKPGDKSEPFSNMASFSDGTRTLIGSDFDPQDIAVLRAV